MAKYLQGPTTPVSQKGARREQAPGCAACGREIEENTPFIIDKDGYNFHPECFRCIKCGDIIPDSQYKPTRDGPVCLTCGLPQCAECMNLIVGDLIVAQHIDGTPYSFHTQCLKCVQCGKNITDKYKATEEGFKCSTCESPQCTSCGRVIQGGSQYYLDQDTYQAQCANCYRTRQQSKVRVTMPNPLPPQSQPMSVPVMHRPTLPVPATQRVYLAPQPQGITPPVTAPQVQYRYI